MVLAIASHIHGCVVDGRAILLDLHRGHYFAVQEPENGAFVRLMESGGTKANAQDDLEVLRRKGWLSESEQPRRISAEDIQKPTEVYRPKSASSAHWPAFASSFAYQLGAWSALKVVPIGRLLATLTKLKSHNHGCLASDGLDEILNAFRTTDRLISANERCLMKSVALSLALIEAGHMPVLVFGVRLHPFVAHAWVQLGNRLLNDELHRVQEYRAIMAV
ncbi:lasso peptide biosynthesis B2 protein [Sphingobium sp. TCM1]|uniref:lasso peptide biosynthesis B2 protein n=1 Tax=Sphingobium sp. TCM1 TaxID=453246 RepID=UPI0018DE6FA0|nr:lasso peptide biosynthesis B2 protein [Sphingobium sp. TCM1]